MRNSVAMLFPRGGAVPPPIYISGLTTFVVWDQNTAIAPLDLNVIFAFATSYSVVAGALPAGVTLSGASISGTPTGFQGRERITIRASGPGGPPAERTFHISVRPDAVNGAFGIPYTTVYNGVNVTAPQTLTTSNTLVINCTISRQLQFRGCDNVLVYNNIFSNVVDGEDLLRLSQTIAPCSRFVACRNTMIGGLKDGINVSGEAPWHTNLHILDNDVGNVGNNPGFEHGMYIWCFANVVGNRIVSDIGPPSKSFGNGISMRSSGRVAYNFIDNTYESGISYYADHTEDTPSLLLIEGNILVGTGTNGSDTDVRLRTDPRIATPGTNGSMVDEYIIRGNVLTQLARAPVIIGDGYGGLIVTGGAGVGVEGNVRRTPEEARAMFPALLR